MLVGFAEMVTYVSLSIRHTRVSCEEDIYIPQNKLYTAVDITLGIPLYLAGL